MSVIFDSAAIFIDSSTNLVDKICKIDLVIDALLTNALEAAGTNNIDEYTLNDGQTIIKTTYRSTESVLKSIKSFEQLRSYYQNKINGHATRMIDHKSIRNGRG